MRKEVEEEFIALFSLSLVIVACAAMVYLVRVPSLTGFVIIDQNSAGEAVSVLVLVCIALLVISLIVFSKLKKEVKEHKDALLSYGSDSRKQLKHYIHRARKSGFSDKHIAEKLKEHWHESEVKKHLK